MLRGEMNMIDFQRVLRTCPDMCDWAHVLTFTQHTAEMFMLSRDDQDSGRLPMRILIAKSLEK